MDKGKHVPADRCKPSGAPIVATSYTTARSGRIVTGGEL